MPEEDAVSTIGSGQSPESGAQHPSPEFGESERDQGGRPKSESSSDGESGSQNGKVDEKQKPKAKSRYARAREWRLALEARERTIAEKEKQWQEREAKAKNPERNYTLEELRHWREQWNSEVQQMDSWDPQRSEREQLVKKADVEIAKMQAEAQQSNQAASFQQQWRQAEATLSQTDPDFMKEGTALDKKIREILSGPDGEHYRRYPLGIVAVYDRAKKELLEEEMNGLRTKFQKTEEENKRLAGLTSIGGGVPGQFGNGSGAGSDFSRLSTKQMKERLLADARRGSGGLRSL